MKADKFNEFFEITTKKDIDRFKVGEKLVFKDSVVITSVNDLPGLLSREQIEKAKQLYNSGMSYRNIAKQFKVSHMTIYRALHKK